MCAIKINEIEAKISDSQARNLVRWALRECEIQKGLQHPRGMAASHESRVDREKAHKSSTLHVRRGDTNCQMSEAFGLYIIHCNWLQTIDVHHS